MKLKLILILSIFPFVSSCTNSGMFGNLPISTFFNNRMTLLLKATYATDSPVSFADYNGGTGDLYQDASETVDAAGVPKAGELGIFIDVGEIRISSKFSEGYGDLVGVQNAEDSQEFWDFITNERQVYCTHLYSFDEDQCKRNGGFVRIHEMFNGEGTVYPSNDPTGESTGDNPFMLVPTIYYYTGIYFRSLVTNFAREAGATALTQFDNVEVPGANIVPRNNYLPGTDQLTKETLAPGMFPLLYSVGEGQFDMGIRGGVDPYILEVRFNLKENLMLHSYTTPASTVKTVVGFSDWQHDHVGESDMGGNLLARSRVIYPETASSLTITGGTGSTAHHYAVYHKQETAILTELPLAAVPVKNGDSNIRYIHEGEYTVYCVGDVAAVDGYPDTIISQADFVVPSYPFRQEIIVDLVCP